MTTETLQVLSPLLGWSAALDDNPDDVFRNRMLGDGVSIDPLAGEVRAPFDGTVLTVPDSKHAINLRADLGAEFLIHVGVDTVGMGGKGFEAHVAPGDRVKAGQLLLSFDLDMVLRSARSLRTPVLLLQSGAFAVEGEVSEGPVEPGQPLFTVKRQAETESTAGAGFSGHEHQDRVAVGLEHGIHARPAAVLVATLKGLDAQVQVSTMDGASADARSAVALMSLGVTHGDTVTVSARGADAESALAGVCSLLQPLEGGPRDSAPVPSVREEATSPPADGEVIGGQTACTGLASGVAFQLQASGTVEPSAAGTAQEEREALAAAAGKVRTHLENIAAGEGAGAEIAAAHLALLDDPLVVVRAGSLIEAGHSAAIAWRGAVDDAIATLRQARDRRMLERVDDLEDINLQVQRTLAGLEPGASPELPEGCIVLAENLLPSQLLEVDRDRIAGICLAAGGATSHVSLLATSLDIPMLVAAGKQVLAIENGSLLQMDAERGELYVRPDKAAAGAFLARAEAEAGQRAIELQQAGLECRTADGVRIHVSANIASADDARAAVQSGAEGCGLLRTEFVFMESGRAPGVAEQSRIYQAISDALGDRPMVVRTLDAGGDKPISWLDQSFEENPALGIRGIRLCEANPQLLRTQLEALLSVNRPAPLQIMIPMVSSVHEVTRVRTMLDELAVQLPARCEVRLGVMIETPAAALIADRLALAADFFSIGTNDLTQYTLCMDRGEPVLASRLDVLHPAVLALVARTVDAANAAGIDVAVCGGAAGEADASAVLLGLGVRELSMPRNLIPRQKARLRKLSAERCAGMAHKALALNSAREVRELARAYVENHTGAEETDEKGR